MHAYEKAIADALNDIADKEIYFHPSEIMSLSDTLTYKVIGTLLSWACQQLILCRLRLQEIV